MAYWNRDLCDPKRADAEPFRAWHDDCFERAVGTPECWQARGHDSPAAMVDAIFGGPEHRAHLEAASDYYAGQIARWRDDAIAHVTPDGYAWGPWRGGTTCNHCGKDC